MNRMEIFVGVFLIVTAIGAVGHWMVESDWSSLQRDTSKSDLERENKSQHARPYHSPNSAAGNTTVGRAAYESKVTIYRLAWKIGLLGVVGSILMLWKSTHHAKQPEVVAGPKDAAKSK